MSPHVQALLFAAFIAVTFAVGFCRLLWLDVAEQIDEATRLPQQPPAPADEPPTERIHLAPVIDLPRRGPKEWTA